MQNEFLDLVTERFDESLIQYIDDPICPYCESKNLNDHGRMSTLVGFGNGPDTNHKWHLLYCNDCKKWFQLESNYYNAWFTTVIPDTANINGEPRFFHTDNGNKIIKGIPTCFENYIYTCKHCGGDVIREYRSLDGISNIYSLKSTMGLYGMRWYRIFFVCQKCGVKVESSNEYYNSVPLKLAEKPNE